MEQGHEEKSMACASSRRDADVIIFFSRGSCSFITYVQIFLKFKSL